MREIAFKTCAEYALLTVSFQNQYMKENAMRYKNILRMTKDDQRKYLRKLPKSKNRTLLKLLVELDDQTLALEATADIADIKPSTVRLIVKEFLEQMMLTPRKKAVPVSRC